MNKFPRWIIALDVLAASVLVAIAGVALYWTAVPVRTFEVSKIEVLNTGGTVKPGEPLLYRAQYCKYVSLQAQTVKQLIGGGAVYPLPTSYGNVPKGCGSVVSRTTLIPVGVADGNYAIEFSITYQVNPLRQETVRFETPRFQVVGGAAPVSAAVDGASRQTGDAVLSSASRNMTRTPTGTSARAAMRAVNLGEGAADSPDEVTMDDEPTPVPTSLPAPGPTAGSLVDALVDLLP